jgi:SAM-dependent methyltransferase
MNALRRPDLEEVISCPECLGALKELDDGTLGCTNCARVFPIRDGIPFFSEVSAEIVPDPGESYVHNKKAWSAWRHRNFDFLAQETGTLAAGSRVIDVGAGPGFFGELFDKHHYVAVDFYPYRGIDLVADIVHDRLPIQSCIADAVILSNVLEHLSKPEPALQECCRILRPGGRVLITVPFLFKIHQAPYDFCRYTHYKLRQMLEQCGFEAIDVSKLGSMLDLLGSLKYEYGRIAMQHTRHPWLLGQALRLDYHVNHLIRKWFVKLDDAALTQQDYFVGYSCVAKKPL